MSHSLHRGSALLGGTLTAIMSSLLHRDYRQLVQGHTARRWQKLSLHNRGEDFLLVTCEHLSYFPLHNNKETNCYSYLKKGRPALAGVAP